MEFILVARDRSAGLFLFIYVSFNEIRSSCYIASNYRMIYDE
jgi:hypothetical protein